MKTLAIANQKGGVAKTTTAVNLSASLGDAGRRTLLIDLDPQANASSGVGLDKTTIERSIYDVLIGGSPPEDLIKETASKGLWILPANLALVGAEVELVTADRREFRLREAVAQIGSKNQFDFVIIDTPPSLGLLTINALTAADSVLIPMQCEYYALEGLAQLYKTIQLVKQKTNSSLYIEGLLFSMVDLRSNLTVQVMNEVKKILKDKVYDSVIPRNIRLAEAPGFGKPILSYDKSSKGAEAYQKLANEFLRRNAPPSDIPPEAVSAASATPSQPEEVRS
jgi:chromosome partitioning protein